MTKTIRESRYQTQSIPKTPESQNKTILLPFKSTNFHTKVIMKKWICCVQLVLTTLNECRRFPTN